MANRMTQSTPHCATQPGMMGDTIPVSPVFGGHAPYEICFRKADGTLARKIFAVCESALKAKILAHALREAGTAQLEVWAGETLIYVRPEHPCDYHRH